MRNLGAYEEASDELFVEFPIYLREQEHHALREKIEELTEEYDGQLEFYQAHQEEIPAPVISGEVNKRIIERYEKAKNSFENVAVRLFLSDDLEQGELNEMSAIGQRVSNSDMVILDLVDVVNFESGGYDYLSAVADIFSENRTVVANAMNIYKGEPYNWGPEIALEYGLDGFGDFAVGGRYPPIIPNLNDLTKTLRHYGVSDFEINEFKGDTYEEAAQKLESWKAWRQDHCPFCRQLGSREDELTRNQAKQVRVGHYIHSVLETDLNWIADQESP